MRGYRECLVNITPLFIFPNCPCQKCIRECCLLEYAASEKFLIANSKVLYEIETSILLSEQLIKLSSGLKEFKLVFRPQSESVKACEVGN